MSKYVFLLLAALFGAQALATEVDVSKESDQVLSGEKVKVLLSGKELNGIGATTKRPLKLTFKADGYLYGVGNGGSTDTGTWVVEGDNLCLRWQRWPRNCRQAAIKDGFFTLKDSSGTFVQTK